MIMKRDEIVFALNSSEKHFYSTSCGGDSDVTFILRALLKYLKKYAGLSGPGHKIHWSS